LLPDPAAEYLQPAPAQQLNCAVPDSILHFLPPIGNRPLQCDPAEHLVHELHDASSNIHGGGAVTAFTYGMARDEPVASK
jgi:hypothetical protein